MKNILPLLALSVISHTALASSDCDVKIRASIPKNLNLNQLTLELYNKRMPITAYEFETCATYDDLSIDKRQFNTNNLSIINKFADGRTNLFTSAAHFQAKEIELSTVSTIAHQACPTTCGYYEFEKLKKDAKIQQFAQQYAVNLSNQNGETTRDQAAKAFAEFYSQAQARFTEMQPTPPPLPHFKEGENYLTSVYGGTHKFFPKAPRQSEIFEKIFEPQKDAFFKKVDKHAFGDKAEPLDQLAEKVYRSRHNWDEFQLHNKELSNAMRATGEPWLIEYAKMTDQAIVDATKQHKAEVERLTTLSGTPFKDLTKRDMSFGDLMGYWSYTAYHQVELNNKEDFATLFSQHYLQQTAPALRQQKHADMSVSYLVSMFDMLLPSENAEKMKRVKGEFDDAAQKQGNKYHLNDGFMDVAFVYENGAWRLERAQLFDPKCGNL